MEVIFGILNAENVRTLVLLVAVASGFVWMDRRVDIKLALRDDKIDKRFSDFDSKLDKRFDDFYMKLKTNDFAHLTAAIEALAYVLKKNNLIDSDDNKFIESKLDKC